MKSAHLDVSTVWCANLAIDSFLHFLRRLIGKGDGEDLRRSHAVLSDEIGDALRDDSCLAGPGPRDDEERSFLMRDGLFLFFVEFM